MRPALAALQAQQKQIEAIQQENSWLRNFALAARTEITVLKNQLHGLATVAGFDGEMEGIRSTALKAIEADINNPAQPVEAPASEAPFQTTQQALEADTHDQALRPGMTPGSVDDLAADTTTTPLVPGTALPTNPYNELQNVEAPVAGTETQRPLSETKIETDVRVGNPNNPEVAFPWTLKSSTRTMASIRLARLQIEAGIAAGDDLALGEKIASTEGLTDEAIAAQIATLSQVRQVQATKQRPAGLVPRAASVARTVPSLATEGLTATAVAEDDGDDEALFD